MKKSLTISPDADAAVRAAMGVGESYSQALCRLVVSHERVIGHAAWMVKLYLGELEKRIEELAKLIESNHGVSADCMRGLGKLSSQARGAMG
jgi:hypothetical protein